MPPSRPPPLVGTMARARPGNCASSSNPAVPGAADDAEIVISGDIEGAAGLAILARLPFGLVKIGGAGDDFGAELAGGFLFAVGGAGGHVQAGMGADAAGGVGQRARMVAGGGADDAARSGRRFL